MIHGILYHFLKDENLLVANGCSRKRLVQMEVLRNIKQGWLQKVMQSGGNPRYKLTQLLSNMSTKTSTFNWLNYPTQSDHKKDLSQHHLGIHLDPNTIFQLDFTRFIRPTLGFIRLPCSKGYKISPLFQKKYPLILFFNRDSLDRVLLRCKTTNSPFKTQTTNL